MLSDSLGFTNTFVLRLAINFNFYWLLILGFDHKQQVYQDICAALDLWLSIFNPDCCFVDDEFKMVLGNTLPLLYNILDLLSMKVC